MNTWAQFGRGTLLRTRVTQNMYKYFKDGNGKCHNPMVETCDQYHFCLKSIEFLWCKLKWNVSSENALSEKKFEWSLVIDTQNVMGYWFQET